VTVERIPPRKGPIKAVGYIDYGGGQVRYSAEGWSWVVASRRKMALKMMRGNCGKDLAPAITDEYSRVDADASYRGEDIDAMAQGDQHYQIERYIHLTYECRLKGAAEPSVSTSTVHGPVLVIPAVSTTTASVELSTAAAVVASTAAVFAVAPSSAAVFAVEPSTAAALTVAPSSAPALVPTTSSATVVVPVTSSSTLAAPEPPR
jgi:hypothetical protein